jgi:F-type H+-transporting ATPase subunit b
MLLAEIHFGPFAIEHPETVLAMLVGLALLVLLLGRFGLPSVRGMLNDRAARIEENHTQVQRALEDVQRQRNDYAARIAQIETEARQRIDAAVREAETARAEIIAEAEQTANALRRRAEEEIARERTRQRIRLRQEIVQLTLNAAEQSVRAHTNESVQRQLIGDFIARAAKDGGNGRSVRAAPSGNGVTAPQPRIPQEGEA